jgi:thiosulfate/3-mercaptopyruvate sulfurtransferase
VNRDNIFIEAAELLTKLDDNNIRIYDATILFFRNEADPATAYEKYLQGHIPGAAFFDHQDISDSSSKYEYMILPEADLVKQIGRIGISQDTEVIFYASGVLPSATRAWWILRYIGHNNVRVLNGGLAAWVKAGGKLEQESRQYEESKFEGQLRPGMFASKEEVLKAMEDRSVCTEYTLPPEMYGGAFIPGSSFISTMDLMQEMDTFVSDDEFVSRLKEEARHERIITYCGGGIAATVNAIAHLIAGNENVSVYDGSLIEWMGEGLPIAKSGKS